MSTQPKDIWNGEIYNANAILQYALDQSVIESYLSFNGREKVLDIGCGDGAITALLAAFVPNGFVLGVDSSPSMIDFAMKAYTPLYPNVAYDHCAVEMLPYKEEFDLVTSFCSLHLVQDVKLSLQNICNALKYEGKALLFFPLLERNPWHQEMIRLLSQTSWGKQLESVLPIATTDTIPLNEMSLHNLCLEVGFTVVDITVRPLSYSFPSRNHYHAWCKAMYTMLARPSNAQEEAELDEIVTKLEEFLQSETVAVPEIGDKVTLTQTFVILQATKQPLLVDSYVY